MLRSIVREVAPAGPGAGDFPRPAPDAAVYAVGDIHGRADLLDRLMEGIVRDAGGAAPAPPDIVFLGDYVDRGPDSRGVLDRMRAWTADPARKVTCLSGNHEAMMLEFLDQTGARGHSWLENGGLATLESFGIDGLHADRGGEAMRAAASRLGDALGADGVAWLRALPLRARRGNVHFVHANADPGRAMDDQRPETLTWGRPTGRQPARTDGQWVVHGHTIVEAPFLGPGRSCIDTGAVHSGRLTALRIGADGGLRYLST